jgi:hypothetical protein
MRSPSRDQADAAAPEMAAVCSRLAKVSMRRRRVLSSVLASRAARDIELLS